MNDKIFEIEGYVKNESNDAFFRLQKPLPPGGRLSFEHAFRVLGKRSEKNGHVFLTWLKDNYFPGEDWVLYNADGSLYEDPSENETTSKNTLDSPKTKNTTSATQAVPVKKVAPAKGAGKVLKRDRKNERTKGSSVTAESMVQPDFAQAKAVIDACKSRSELRKALSLSKIISKKEEHMRYIHNRLQQV